MRLDAISPQRRIARAVAAGLMLALWFVTSAVAVSPPLHHWLHNGSNAPTHECLFTQLNKGSLLASVGCVAVTAPSPSCEHQPCWAESQHFPVSDPRVSPSRAPPAVSSSSTVVG